MSAGSVDGLVIFLFYCICISKMGGGGGGSFLHDGIIVGSIISPFGFCDKKCQVPQ